MHSPGFSRNPSTHSIARSDTRDIDGLPVGPSYPNSANPSGTSRFHRTASLRTPGGGSSYHTAAQSGHPFYPSLQSQQLDAASSSPRHLELNPLHPREATQGTSPGGGQGQGAAQSVHGKGNDNHNNHHQPLFHGMPLPCCNPPVYPTASAVSLLQPLFTADPINGIPPCDPQPKQQQDGSVAGQQTDSGDPANHEAMVTVVHIPPPNPGPVNHGWFFLPAPSHDLRRPALPLHKTTFVDAIGVYLNKFRGDVDIPLVRPPPAQLFWSWLGAFLGILLVAGLNHVTINHLDFQLLIGSFGASAVLVYGCPESKMAQPRNLMGGQIISAIVGIITRIVLHDVLWVATAVGMSLALLAMQLTRTTHPPGGATALIICSMKDLPPWQGFQFMLTVIFGSAGIMLVGLILNNLAGNRQYPTYWI